VELLSFDDVNVFIFILFILFLLFFYFWGEPFVLLPPNLPFFMSPRSHENHHKWNSFGLRLECVTEKPVDSTTRFYIAERIFFPFFFFFLGISFHFGMECFSVLSPGRVRLFFCFSFRSVCSYQVCFFVF
jgi:hypothetical protein